MNVEETRKAGNSAISTLPTIELLTSILIFELQAQHRNRLAFSTPELVGLNKHVLILALKSFLSRGEYSRTKEEG